jgi:hypothetical protein
VAALMGIGSEHELAHCVNVRFFFIDFCTSPLWVRLERWMVLGSLHHVG